MKIINEHRIKLKFTNIKFRKSNIVMINIWQADFFKRIGICIFL